MNVDELLRGLRDLERSADEGSSNIQCVQSTGLQGCTHCSFCEDSTNSYRCTHSSKLTNCTGLTWSKNCESCHSSAYLQDCRHCVDSAYLIHCVDLADCHHCIGCVGLVGCEFHILNKSYQQKEYFDILERLKVELGIEVGDRNG